MTTWVVVHADGKYLAGYCAHFAPKYDGDDESFVIRPRWESDWRDAKVFETERGAKAASTRLGAWQTAAVGGEDGTQ